MSTTARPRLGTTTPDLLRPFVPRFAADWLREAPQTRARTFEGTLVFAAKAILLAGAPRSAGGDEEELVLRTARAIVVLPGRLPVRVGVNAGRVFAGIVGPPLDGQLSAQRYSLPERP